MPKSNTPFSRVQNILFEIHRSRGKTYICCQFHVATHAEAALLKQACDEHLATMSEEQISKINDRAAREERREREAWARERKAAEAARKLKASERPGMVYLMRNKRNGFIKIGFSNNPKYREGTLQSQEPEIELMAAWPGTQKIEEELHAKFSARRLRGEWFSLTDAEVDAVAAHMNALLAA